VLKTGIAMERTDSSGTGTSSPLHEMSFENLDKKKFIQILTRFSKFTNFPNADYEVEN
jgi:hypothetical protein